MALREGVFVLQGHASKGREGSGVQRRIQEVSLGKFNHGHRRLRLAKK